MASVGYGTVEFDGLHGRVYLSPGPGSGGAAERPVFVLVHGIGVSHRYLARLHARLARSGPVCSIDLPGFGSNPKPGRQLSVGDFAAFIAKALQACGIASCVFVGHSMGVQFGLELARTYPGLVSRLVLMGPVVDMFRRQVVRQALALGLDTRGSHPESISAQPR
jgi:pimeloyl-ACP methyl ester carboxylesterase